MMMIRNETSQRLLRPERYSKGALSTNQLDICLEHVVLGLLNCQGTLDCNVKEDCYCRSIEIERSPHRAGKRTSTASAISCIISRHLV
jgi:hypothetical protein